MASAGLAASLSIHKNQLKMKQQLSFPAISTYDVHRLQSSYPQITLYSYLWYSVTSSEPYKSMLRTRTCSQVGNKNFFGTGFKAAGIGMDVGDVQKIDLVDRS